MNDTDNDIVWIGPWAIFLSDNDKTVDQSWEYLTPKLSQRLYVRNILRHLICITDDVVSFYRYV